MIAKYRDKSPVLHLTSFVAQSADIIGNLTIGEHSSIWFGTVARADFNKIVIGKYTNVQDRCIIHCENSHPTILGDYITVGHGVTLHGCVVGNNCLIGMGSIILGGVEIGDNVMVGAGALVTRGKKIPSNSLVVGTPAKVLRELTSDEVHSITKSALQYVELAKEYKIDGMDI